MKLGNILAALFVTLVAFEVLEYYAVSTTKFTYIEVAGSVEGEGGLSILTRAYISKPNPLPVRLLSLQVTLTCDGASFYSELRNITVTRGDFTVWVPVKAEGEVRGSCRLEASAIFTTNLLFLVGIGVARENQSTEFESGILRGPLLWAGWNASSISSGSCSELIVLAGPNSRYVVRVYEEYYGQPAKVVLEEEGSGNMTKLFCVPKSISPLVVKGYYVSLEDLSSGARRDQAFSYPPRLKLRS
ncbi:MAG: hypothetical protein QXJ21_01440 [Thermofilum sp.]